ncbi:KfrB domain-containing protein [Cupriavidus sp. D39]
MGRGCGVVHDASAFARPPKLGATVRISYERGRGRAEEPNKQQMSLGLV